MINVSLSRGIGRIELARPDKKNAFNGEMLVAIQEAIQQFGDDPACRAIVLCSQGDTFSAGADLAWMASQADAGREANVENAKMLGAVFHSIAQSKKPVVGRIQGPARGGGVGLTAAVDIAVASEKASFALTEVRLGLLPGVISPFVVERIGPSRARALFMTGETVNSQEAWRIGLVHHVVPHDDLDAKIEEVLGLLVLGGPEALLSCKRLVELVKFQPPQQVFDKTAELIADARASAEAQAGMMAFLTRQPAPWIPKQQAEQE